MIHPATEVKLVSPEIGMGVFATQFIPKGSITYILDEMELIYPQDHPLLKDTLYLKHINKYSYIDNNGNRILSWDIAKYMNHYCDFNSISTGYGFEIAIRDIEAGEQITDDYGTLNIEKQMSCGCGKANCRKTIYPDDLLKYSDVWDEYIKEALKNLNDVPQPLLKYMDNQLQEDLDIYLKTGKSYTSIRETYFDRVEVDR
jgi:uncharacterized protein